METKRLESLDALRGFDMLLISGLAVLVSSLCNAFDASGCWLDLQMKHAAWDGLKLYDTVFPLFLFIAGVTFPFSYEKHKDHIYRKIFFRTVVLILLGMVYNGCLRLDFSNMRFYSVLGRIGVAWMTASLFFVWFGKKLRAVIGILILVGYWFLCMISAPDVIGSDPLSMEGCLAGWVDRCICPGHLYNGTFDPEGLLGTIPAIVTAMLGMFAGELLKKEEMSGNRKTLALLCAAAVLFVTGLVWSIWFPVNKQLWTSSFVLVVGAYSTAMLAFFYWVIDVKGWRKWAFPLKVVGMNSITIYLLYRIIDFREISSFFFGGFASLCPEAWGKVILNAGSLSIVWLVMYFLYKHNIFLKV